MTRYLGNFDVNCELVSSAGKKNDFSNWPVLPTREKKKRTLRSNVISPSKDGFSKLFHHVLSSFDNRQSVRVLTLTFHFSSKTVFDWIVTQINNGKNECLTREISNYAELQISTIFVYSGAQRPSSGRRTLFLAVRPTVHTTDSSRKRSFS